MTKVKLTVSGIVDIPDEQVDVAGEMDIDIAATLIVAEGENAQLKVSRVKK